MGQKLKNRQWASQPFYQKRPKIEKMTRGKSSRLIKLGSKIENTTFSSKVEKFTRLYTSSSKFEKFSRLYMKVHEAPCDLFVKIWKVHKAPCDLFVKIWTVHKAIALWLFRQNLWPFRQNLKSWLFCQNLNLKTFSSKFESSQGYSRFVKFGSKVEKNDKG